MAGKDPREKEKSKVRIKVDKTDSPAERDAKKRLAELELEMQMENSKSSVTPELVQTASSEISAPLAKDETLRRETAETLFATHKHSKKLVLFWGVMIASVVLSKIPGAEIFFTPLNQFATLVHEMSHAVVCVATGGHVAGMTIVADGAGHGGLTMSQGGIPFFTVQAGYLGTAVVGCFLVWLSQFHKLSRGILVGIGSIIGLSVFFIAPAMFTQNFVQGFFSLLWALAMAAGTIYAGLKLKESNANLMVLFLAIYTAMDSMRAISVVLTATLFGSMIWSDATVMEHNFILPAVFWSFLWATLSAVMLATTVWFTYGLHGLKKNGKQLPKANS